MQDTEEWLKSGKYLPPFLRDFHAQKRIFKWLAWASRWTDSPYLKEVTWTAAHIFVIDYFLWIMARHGWTLQRSRSKLEYDDLESKLQQHDEIERESLRKMFTKPLDVSETDS